MVYLSGIKVQWPMVPEALPFLASSAGTKLHVFFCRGGWPFFAHLTQQTFMWCKHFSGSMHFVVGKLVADGTADNFVTAVQTILHSLSSQLYREHRGSRIADDVLLHSFRLEASDLSSADKRT